MQVDGRGPLGVVFLVYGNVVAVAYDERLRRPFDLYPCLVGDDVVLAELGTVHHNAQLVLALAAFCRNLDEQVVVAVPDVGDFDIGTVQFLRDFFAAVDAVLDESAAFDFPAVVDSATGGKVCAKKHAQRACGDNGKTSRKCGFHIPKIEKKPGAKSRRELVFNSPNH